MKFLIDLIKNHKSFFKIGFAILSLVLLLILLDGDSIVTSLDKVNYCLLLGTLFLIITRHYLQSFRFLIILKFNEKWISINEIVRQYFIGYYYNFFLPSSIGGDVARLLMMQRPSLTKSEAAVLIFYERFFGFFSLSFISVLSIPFLPLDLQLKLGIIGLFLFFIAIGFSCYYFFKNHNYKIFGKIELVIRNLSLTSIFVIFLLSLLFQAFSIVVRYILAIAFDIHVPIHYFFLFIPLINVITMLPISFNGVGTREAAFIYFFGLVGLNQEESFVLSLTSYVMLVFLAIIGGVVNLKESLDLKKT